jgi:hypothetical protein
LTFSFGGEDMKKITLSLALSVLLFGTSGIFGEDCLNVYLQQGILRAILASPSVRVLRRVRATSVFKNDVTEAVYSLRMYELQPTAVTEESLIQRVPRSDIALSLLYHLTYPEAEPADRPRLFDQYLDTVYKVVAKSRKRYPVLLRLAVLAQGGDLGESVSDCVNRLYTADPVGVSEALLAMPQTEARLVCGEDAVPCPRKPDAATPRPRRNRRE